MLVSLLLISGLALYAISLFAWLGATPLSAERHEQVRYDLHFWSAIFVVSALLAAWIVAWMVWLRRESREKISA